QKENDRDDEQPNPTPPPSWFDLANVDYFAVRVARKQLTHGRLAYAETVKPQRTNRLTSQSKKTLNWDRTVTSFTRLKNGIESFKIYEVKAKTETNAFGLAFHRMIDSRFV